MQQKLNLVYYYKECIEQPCPVFKNQELANFKSRMQDSEPDVLTPIILGICDSDNR